MELIICMKMDLALNNLQRLICHKTQITNQQLRYYIHFRTNTPEKSINLLIPQLLIKWYTTVYKDGLGIE